MSLPLTTTIQDLQPQRQIKLFTHILALEEKLENIITAAPDWELSSGLQVRIYVNFRTTPSTDGQEDQH